MPKKLQHLIYLFLGIILIPAAGITYYELRTLNQNEKALTDIYERQLDGILFSLNQYADDIVNSWAVSINRHVQELPKNSWLATDMVDEQTALDGFAYLKDGKIYGTYPDTLWTKDLIEQSKSSISAASDDINKLPSFLSGGYRKIEACMLGGDSQYTLLIFALDPNPDSLQFALCLLNEQPFLRDVVGRKVAELAGDELVLSIVQGSPENSLVMSAGDITNSEMAASKPFWSLPNYELAIGFPGKSLKQLLKERSQIHLSLIFLLNGLMIIGIIFMIRNVRREISLAQAKSDFVSNVSHEIRTPLSLISMFAETLYLDRVPNEEKRKKYYEIILQESKRLGGIVNKILSFSKIDAGKEQFEFGQYPLNKVVTQVVDHYQYHLAKNGFTYEVNLAEALPNVRMDKEAIGEAILNLIDNAVKYSADHKIINIRTEIQDSFVTISVSDKGIGIPVSKQQAVFDKFYRVQEGEIHNTKGTGLGLTLVKHIVEAHQGYITVDSKPGHGSTFTIFLPGTSEAL